MSWRSVASLVWSQLEEVCQKLGFLSLQQLSSSLFPKKRHLCKMWLFGAAGLAGVPPGSSLSEKKKGCLYSDSPLEALRRPLNFLLVCDSACLRLCVLTGVRAKAILCFLSGDMSPDCPLSCYCSVHCFSMASELHQLLSTRRTRDLRTGSAPPASLSLHGSPNFRFFSSSVWPT